MDVKELRIGNLVYAFKTNYVIDNTDFEGEKIKTYKPVKLTKELLLKCGAKQNGCFYILKLDVRDYKIEFIFTGNTIVQVNLLQDKQLIFLKNNYKYVHQLQNLYFALIGTELEIKL